MLITCFVREKEGMVSERRGYIALFSCLDVRGMAYNIDECSVIELSPTRRGAAVLALLVLVFVTMYCMHACMLEFTITSFFELPLWLIMLESTII